MMIVIHMPTIGSFANIGVCCDFLLGLERLQDAPGVAVGM
jgi:hypothetical protein